MSQISPETDELGALTRLLDEAWPAPHWDMARKILDAGYVLRGLAQTPAVPDGYVLVPRELTAENGAKSALIGEFSETFDYMDDEGDECQAEIPVSWITIKRIHRKMVELFALADTSTDSEVK